MNDKAIQNMVSQAPDVEIKAITTRDKGQTGISHQNISQAHPGQIERIICKFITMDFITSMTTQEFIDYINDPDNGY